MISFSTPPVLPTTFTSKACEDAFALSLAELNFGFRGGSQPRYDYALATLTELRTIPRGLLGTHHVLVPDEIPLKSEEEILERLERMVNSVRDRRAIEAILWQVAIPRLTDKGKAEWQIQIDYLKILARNLARDRLKNPHFVDALLRGYLGEGAKMLADGAVTITRSIAKKYLIDLSVLWGIHDLQVIACRLFQSTRRPTGGWLEGSKYRPQTFEGLNQLSFKIGTYLETVRICLDRESSGNDFTNNDADLAKRITKLRGFCYGSGIMENAVKIGIGLGYSRKELFDRSTPTSKAHSRQFISTTDRGITITTNIQTTANKSIPDRSKPTEDTSPGKHLHVSSFQDGTRPEVALSYAIITFFHMVIDIPRRLESFLDNPTCDALTDTTLKACNLKHVRCYIDELIEAFRAIYLWDENHRSKECPVDKILNPAPRLRLSDAEVRKILIEHQSARLREDPFLRRGPLPTGQSRNHLGRSMFEDALEILRKENALPTDNPSQALAPDPQLSPALAWRFACTYANVPPPDTVRPFIPQF